MQNIKKYKKIINYLYNMQLREIIKTSIRKYLNEQHILNENLDLSNRDNVVTWLDKNAPESIFDDDGNIDWDYTDPMTGDDLETLIYTYMEKYDEVTSETEIEIYRLIKLNTIKDLDLKNVGVFWSFEEDGVGAYGVGQNFSGNNSFVLNAIVNIDDINWEQGFYSFLGYGKSEFECYMKKGSRCLITHINEKELQSPIEAVC
jgi:hypothetical protein